MLRTVIYLESTLFRHIISIFFFSVMNTVMNNLISLCISWIVSWNGGIAESKGMCIFEAFDTHCQIAVLIESPSSRLGSPREPSGLLLSGDAVWVIHEGGAGNSF